MLPEQHLFFCRIYTMSKPNKKKLSQIIVIGEEERQKHISYDTKRLNFIELIEVVYQKSFLSNAASKYRSLSQSLFFTYSFHLVYNSLDITQTQRRPSKYLQHISCT